jgi:hypothetical protein
MQKEILNALLQHHAMEAGDVDASRATMRYVIDNRHGSDNGNVKVEAEPTASSGAEMSPESLTAISGHHPETSGHVMKSDEVDVKEFMET